MGDVTYEPVIGLEIHVQLSTRTKMFCSCPPSFGEPPNTRTCPVCLGLPGTLPVVNAEAIHFGLMIGLALGSELAPRSIFHRKNYFYPDLPKGYQISQYDEPLCRGGQLGDVRIHRVHLEEDAAKLNHVGASGRIHGSDASLVDFNRGGTPLAEIVSEPDLRTAEDAAEWLKLLRTTLRRLGVSDVNMEEGSLRCDANISLRPRGQEKFGTKAEVKNVNSFRFIKQALEYEIERQAEILSSGGTIAQETRLYNSSEGKTYSMRSKEQAHDYRYFPEPDLLPLVVDSKWQAEIRSELPELPEALRARLVKDYGITEQDAGVLTATRARSEQFEKAAKAAKSPKRVANLVQGELMGRLKAKGLELEQSPITMAGVAASADLVEAGTISGKMLKDLYDLAFERGKDFPAVYEEEGRPQQSTDTGALEKIIDEVIAANPKQLEQYRGGKTTVIAFFVGQVMKASKGSANPAMVNELLKKKLG